MDLDVRTVFLSDSHIGYSGSDLWSLVDFLRRVRCRYLFLNGDIVDNWKLEKSWRWPEAGTAIFREIAIKHLTGTKVIFLPGNHDDLFRRIDPWTREIWARHIGIQIRNTHVHKSADGKRWLVLHGDQFDAGILRAGLARWSDKAWVEFAKLMPIRMSPTPGAKAFSLARELAKKAGKKALAMINRFESAALRRTQLRNTDGVICGHTHIPVLKTIGRDTLYANSGMWQGNGKNTALVEDWNGSMRIVSWPAVSEHDIAACQAPSVIHDKAQLLALKIKRWVRRALRRQSKVMERVRRTFSPVPERGNILFLILLAIVLFAALSYAIMGQREQAPASVNKEQAESLAATIMQEASLLEQNMLRAKVVDGIKDYGFDLSGVNSNSTANSTCTAINCQMLKGGKSALLDIPDWASTTSVSTEKKAYFLVLQILDVATPAEEVVYARRNLRLEVCQAINRAAGATVNLTINDDMDGDNVLRLYSGTLTSVAASGSMVGDIVASVKGRHDVCLKNSSWGYIYYHVLIPR